MKKILVLIGILALCSSAAFGDEVDEGLPEGMSEQLKSHTREMIRLGAHSDEALRMTRLMDQNRFQVENTIRAQETVMKALREGLPAEPVMNKAFEGMAKGVRAGEIVRAMETTRSRYAYAYGKARDIAGKDSQPGGIGDIIAEGMAAGLTEEDAGRIVERLRTQARDADRDQTRDRTHALARESFMAVREMARRGVTSNVAAEAVSQALEHGYQEREMEMLRHSFMKQSKQGDPQRIAENYSYAIRNGAPSDNLGPAGRNGDAVSGGTAGGAQSGNGPGGAGSGSSGSDSGSGSGGSGSGGSGSGGSGHGSGGSGSGKK